MFQPRKIKLQDFVTNVELRKKCARMRQHQRCKGSLAQATFERVANATQDAPTRLQDAARNRAPS